MKISRGMIVITEFEEKVIPYIVLYNESTQLLDIHCANCGKLYMFGCTKKQVNDFLKELKVFEIININKWIAEKGYKVHGCKKPVTISKTPQEYEVEYKKIE
jgi:hypothetical protein